MTVAFCPPVPVADFQKLYDPDNTTKREYDRVQELVNVRFYYVFVKFMEIQGCTISWVDYSNGGEEDKPGVFEPEYYKDEITFVGDYKDHTRKWRKCPYYDSFPTKWIYEEFETAFAAEFEQEQVAKATAVEQARQAKLAAQTAKHTAKTAEGPNKKAIMDGLKAKLSTGEYAALVSLKKKMTEAEIKLFFQG